MKDSDEARDIDVNARGESWDVERANRTAASTKPTPRAAKHRSHEPSKSRSGMKP